MIVTTVVIHVKPENVNDFITATTENHVYSVQETGNLRFDFLQALDDPCRFFLYEVYETEAASKAHKNTKHYQKWKDRVAPWMSKPREGVSHTVIQPRDTASW